MKFVHTSDWHLGATLGDQRRGQEHALFLDWLADLLDKEQADAVLIAGDVYDRDAPGSHAQQQYFRFLDRQAQAGRHVVVTAGNHDSGALISAPRELLARLRITAIGEPPENPEDEVAVLRGQDGTPLAVVAAVPFLPDRFVRRAAPGQGITDREEQLAQGIAAHYARMADIAQQRRQELGAPVPLIAMGHLYAAGCAVAEDENEQPLYIGSLGQVSGEVFPACFDYVALGHLHTPQQVGGTDRIRYSGAPLALSFGERGEKSVVVAHWTDGAFSTRCVPVDFAGRQQLASLEGDLDEILARLDEMRRAQSSAWLSIRYTGKEMRPNLEAEINARLADTAMRLVTLHNMALSQAVLSHSYSGKSTNELTPMEIFMQTLDANAKSDLDRDTLAATFRQALEELKIHPDAV